MKKILFITGQLNAGGAERVLIDILRHFDYTKYHVDLCQIIEGGTLIDEVPTNVNEEDVCLTDGISPLHKDVYYLDGLTPHRAIELLNVLDLDIYIDIDWIDSRDIELKEDSCFCIK